MSWQLVFFSRVKKQKMLEEVGSVLGVTPQDVSAKIHSLRTQFNRECSREKKTKSGSSSDETFVSKWEYMSSLQFLKINAVDSITISNLVTFFKKIIHIFVYIMESMYVFYFRYNFQDVVTEELSSDGTESIILFSESSDTQSEYGETSDSNNKRHRFPVLNSKKAKRRNLEETTDDALMNKALAVINQPNDDLDIFGQFVASEMRQISDLSSRKLVKNEIMRALLICSQSSVLVTTETTTLPENENTDFEYIVL